MVPVGEPGASFLLQRLLDLVVFNPCFPHFVAGV